MSTSYSPNYEHHHMSSITASEKDTLISQLKTQIFDLEQNQKNYNALERKYRSLSNEN